MQYDNIFNDFFYSTTATTLSYRIEDENGEPVFIGRAVGDSAGTRVNVAQKIRDWLFNDIGDFRESDGEFFDHPDAIHAFSLVDLSDNAVKEQWMVIYSFEPWNGDTLFLTTAINTHASPLQKLFITNGAKIDVPTHMTQDIDDGGPGDGPGGGGDKPPYIPPGDYSDNYLTVRFNEDATVRFYKSPNAQISIDNGEWIDIVSSSVTLSEEYTFRAGQTVRFAEYILQDKGYTEVYTRLLQTDASFDAYGNVYSITHGHSFTGTGCRINGDKYLYGVFEGTRVRDARYVVMPSDLRDNVSEGMSGGGLWFFFRNCTELERAPELTAMHVPDLSYQQMFAGCTSLTKAPNLPATSVMESGYAGMFAGCTSLVTPPTFGYTATTAYMCTSMFEGCTSLTIFPDLPAVTVVGYAYAGMFSYCTSLRRVVVPSSAVNALSLYQMFYGCSSLSSVRLDATQWGSAWGSSWLYGVSPTGYFYTPVPEAYASITRGPDTVPENWTIVGV